MSNEESTIIQGYLKRMQDEYENFNTVYNDLLTKLNLAQTEYTKQDSQFKKLLTDETNSVTIYSSSTRQNFNTEFEKVQSAAQAKILNISQVPEELDEFIKLANLDLEGVRNQLNEISQNVAAIKDEANAQIDSINRELPKVTEAGQKAIEDMNKVVNQVTASGQTLQQQINELDLRLSGIVNNQSNISKDITAIQETNKAINASQEALLKLIDQTDDRIDQINQQIGDIVNIRTDIDTLKINKADKTFVDEQLADIAINVKNFGATGDGVTDDSAAVQNAINAAANNAEILFPDGVYVIKDVQIPANKNVRLIGRGVDVTVFDTPSDFITFTLINTAVSTQVYTSNIQRGDHVITVSSATGILVGQLVTIETTQPTEETAFAITRSHSARVASISGNQIRLDRPFPSSFSNSFTIRMKFYNVGKVEMEGFTIKGLKTASYLVNVVNSAGFTAKNINFVGKNASYDLTDTGTNAFRCLYSVDSYFSNLDFKHICYGVLPTTGSNNTTLENSTAFKCRHIAAPTGSQYSFFGRNLKTYSCYAGIDSHQGSYTTVYENIQTFDDQIPNKLRGRRDILINSELSGGLEMTNDTPLFSSSEAREDLDKVLRTVVSRKNISITAVNLNAEDVVTSGSFWATTPSASLPGNVLTMKKVRCYPSVNYFSDGAKKIVLRLAFFNESKIENVQIFGPYEGVPQTAYDSANDTSAVVMERVPRFKLDVNNLVIDGFPIGIEFLGGLDLAKCSFKNVTILNCGRGIDPRTSNKDNGEFENFRFEGNFEDINEPFRFRNSVFTGNNNAMYPRTVFGTTIPTVGTFRVGDRVINTTPTAGGYAGWVCITAGTPGTWKGFGLIQT